MFPDPILQQIFSHLSLPHRLKASRVCRQWYYNCNDPHLYQNLQFEHLEFNILLKAMQHVTAIRPRIKTITMVGCYSDFIRNTVVPVHFSQQQPKQPVLFSPIQALQPVRRRQEYQRRNFELHNHFSDLFSQFLALGQYSLHSIKILDCDLDFEMTELFCSIACHAQTLETFHYMNNGDKGLSSSGLLQAIVSGCPNMHHFRGFHAGMNDTVLTTITRHWPNLESLTLSGVKSKELQNASSAETISHRAFWELLSKLRHLRLLELHDVCCITNRDLALYNSNRDNLCNQKSVDIPKPKTMPRYKPYDTQSNRHFVSAAQPSHFPGTSLKELVISKYTTTPLSTPGFRELVQLFPNLKRLSYATNFYTFSNQFEGVTSNIYEAERLAVKRFMGTQTSIAYVDQWNQPITIEQRLLAGVTARSDQL